MDERLSSESIPFLDLRVDVENKQETVRTVLSTVKPEWNLDTIVEKELPSGSTNSVTAYFPDPDTDSDGLVIRRLHPYFHNLLHQQRHTHKFFHDQNLAPPIRAFFHNGFCQDFQHGQTFTPTEIFESQNWTPVISQLARWHSTNIREKAVDCQLRYVPAYIFPTMEKEYPRVMNGNVMSMYKDLFPTVEDILHEERSLVEQMQKRGAFKLCVTHGDMNPSNPRVNRDNWAAVLMDNDYSGVYFAEMDLISFFYSVYDTTCPNFSLVPSKDSQLEVLQEYLDLKGMIDETQDERTALDLYHDVQCALPLFYLRFIVMTAFLADKDDSAGNYATWLTFAMKLWNEYDICKRDVLENRDAHYREKELLGSLPNTRRTADSPQR